MIFIPGYQLAQLIYQGIDTAIYRGMRISDKQPVILKILISESPPLSEISCLKQEYSLLKNLQVAGIVKTLSLETHQNRLVLVLEDFGGISLKKAIEKQPLDLITFLSYAIQLTETLGHLHTAHIIHKDLKPKNIIVNVATGIVKITDFGIATQLTRETQQVSNPELLEGTLAYMSPEQTGRMNRSIDYRADFYSLGVTFYEMLTGELPFQSDDPLELVYCHIAQSPQEPHQLNPEVPPVLSAIVMKLMAKNAEDRYQSAWGLKADLERCLMQLTGEGKIAPFVPGQQDKSGQLSIPQKLYGREKEVELLLDAFDRVASPNENRGASSSSIFMLVSGYSGIGKSSLVSEVHKPITALRGYFISGKFDQFKRDIPYDCIIQAFQDLMRQLLAESAQQLQLWKQKLLAALGSNGQVIVDVIPEVELIIGKQPHVPQLGPTESQNRFNRVFHSFIHVFTKPEHPLVVFLDDLQWADAASLKLIQLVMTDRASQYLLLIGAYRDNEVSPSHPLMHALYEIQQAGAIVNNIILRPLALTHVRQIIADTLQAGNQSDPLAELLFHKTQGNPFFLTQMLKTLDQEELLSFDFAAGLWTWDIEQIQAFGITDLGVVELIASNIRKLPPGTQVALQLAACIGDRFSLDILTVIGEKPSSEVTDALWPALQAGLILPLTKEYKIPRFLNSEELEMFSFDESNLAYKFLHDRVQQAAYSLIPDGNKQATHWRIGQLLLENTPPDQIEANIFDIVNQLNVGISCAANQRDELARLNLIAGQKAKLATAYEPALKYLKAGMGILAEDSWETEYRLTLDFFLEKIECHYILRNFDRAEELAYIALNQAKTNLDKADINSIRLIHYQNNARYEEAIKVGLSTLEFLGVTLPYAPSQADILSAAAAAKANLGNSLAAGCASRQISDLLDAPKMADKSSEMVIRILMNLVPPTYLINQPLLALGVLTMVSICFQYGNTNLAGFVYAWYGTILCAKFGEYATGYEFGCLALKVSEKFQNTSLDGRLYMSFGNFILPWRRPVKENIPIQKKAYTAAMTVGDFSWCHHSALFSFWQRLTICQNLKSLQEEFENYIGFAKETEPTAGWALVLQHALLLNLQGLTDRPSSFSYAGFDESEALDSFQSYEYGRSTYYFAKLFISLIYEEGATAYSMALEAEKRLAVVDTQFQLALHYIYKALAILANYSKTGATEQQQFWEALQECRRKIAIWAQNCPENFLACSLLVEAETARLVGDRWQASELYDEAIQAAKDNEQLLTESLAREIAAKFYFSVGRRELAETYMAKAYACYSRLGALRKVSDLEEKYPQLLVNSRRLEISTPDVERTLTKSSSTGGVALDLATVLKASQAIASEIILDNLLQKLMKILLESAAAETGVLILSKDNQLLIEATGNAHQPDSVSVRQSIPLETSRDIPLSAIEYVARSREVLVLNNAATEKPFNEDPYIQQRQTKSILCAPILNQGELSGILYLENNLTKGAFNPKRLELLKLLSAQAAISIRNAVLYQQSQTYAEAAESANRAKSEFLANMSHELRTPLNAILGFTQVMVREKSLSIEYQQYLEIISRSGEHLLSLIDNILEMSKIEAGRLALNENTFDLIRLLATLEGMLRLRAESKGLQLVFDLAADIPQYVVSDESKLRSCLINLLGNAIKFTSAGSVTLRVRRSRSLPKQGNSGGMAPSENDSQRSRLIFEVEDTGPGIREEEINLLFEPFGQTEIGRNTQGGTGLGLTIARKYVHLMGGDISARSQLGKGSIFSFDTQVGLTEAAEIQTTQSDRKVTALAPNQGEYRILIVEDRLENRLLLVKQLTAIGLTVREAVNGLEAVEVWENWQPHLIWMDMRMPVMDGCEAARQIRARERIRNGTAPVAIIALTANAFEEDRDRAIAAGCDDFVRKPFQEDEIFEKMALYLGVRYLYEGSSQLPAVSGEPETKAESYGLTPESLAVMPAEWIAKLQAAALSAREKDIWKLIEQIPPEEAALKSALAQKVQDFRLDQIIDITSHV